MICGARILTVAVALLAFAAGAWAVVVSSVRGEASYDTPMKIDVPGQTISFGATSYKWSELIEIQMRPSVGPPKGGYKIFLRNGSVLYADIVGAQTKGVQLILKARSPFLGGQVVELNADDLAGVQSLNPVVYQRIAVGKLRTAAKNAPFRVIEFAGKILNEKQIEQLFQSEPDKFVGEGEKRLAEKSAQFEKFMTDKIRKERDYIYGVEKTEASGTIIDIDGKLDVTLETKSGNKVKDNLSNIVGLGFKQVNQPAGFGDKPYVRVVGVSGDTVTGQIVSEKDGVLELRTDVGSLSVKVMLSEVSEIAFFNGSFVFLSDLPDSAVSAVEYSDLCEPGAKTNPTFPWQRDRSTCAGRPPLQVNGRVYHKGIGAHSHSELTFDLNGGYKKFRVTAGIDDNTGKDPAGSVTVAVFGDGKPLFPKTRVKAGASVQVEADVTGVKKLQIVVDFGENGYQNGHCDLVNAILVK